jgi:hypothetical protein
MRRLHGNGGLMLTALALILVGVLVAFLITTWPWPL